MACKFERINELGADCYEVWFTFNGQKKSLFYSGIDSLMETVLSDDNFDGKSEWEQWCEDGTLPETYGYIENEIGEGDIEFAEKYFKECEDCFEIIFDDVA